MNTHRSDLMIDGKNYS